MKRYHAWAGIGNMKMWESVLNDLLLPEVNAIWPIVDSETCGEIKGFPTPKQFFCVTFSSMDQQKVTDALNEYDSLMKRGGRSVSVPGHKK